MTRTAQSRSWAALNEAGRDLTIKKPKKDDNARLLLAVYDSLYELYEKLCRLSHVMEKRIVEYNLSHEDR